MGYGRIIGNGKRLCFISNGYKSVESVEESVEEVSRKCRGVESTTNSELQEIKDKSVEEFSEKTQPVEKFPSSNQKIQPPEKPSSPNQKTERDSNSSTLIDTLGNHSPETQIQSQDKSSTVSSTVPSTLIDTFPENALQVDLEAANSLNNKGQQQATMANTFGEWKIGDRIKGKVFHPMGMMPVKGKVTLGTNGKLELTDKDGTTYPLKVVEEIESINWEDYHLK